MCKCSEILDEMIKTLDTIYCDSSEGWEVRWLYDAMKWILWEAKSRIQALQSGVQTITIPEWTVLLGKDEYESLKEKAWRYDDLSNS